MRVDPRSKEWRTTGRGWVPVEVVRAFGPEIAAQLLPGTVEKIRDGKTTNNFVFVVVF